MRGGALQVLLVAALAGCAGARSAFAPDAPAISLAFGGDGRGAIGPCG